MRRIVLILGVLWARTAYADLASTSYVNTAIESRVDTSADAKQTMAGTYTVSGSLTVTGAFKVPTPPLPNPDTD